MRSSPADGRSRATALSRGATGAAELLVVGDGRRRRTDVDAEREVGFVEAHAERRRGDERFDVVSAKSILQLIALGRRHRRRVGGDVEPAVSQNAGAPLGLGDGEHVHDAGTRELFGRVCHPRRAVHSVEAGHDGELERRAQRHGAGAELHSDVGNDPSVGGRRRWSLV